MSSGFRDVGLEGNAEADLEAKKGTFFTTVLGTYGFYFCLRGHQMAATECR